MMMMLIAAGRCITVQGFEGRFGGLYDDSLSDPSDSSRTDIPDDTLAVYKTMNKEVIVRFFSVNSIAANRNHNEC